VVDANAAATATNKNANTTFTRGESAEGRQNRIPEISEALQIPMPFEARLRMPLQTG
jgi:hypothetical protein